MDFLQSIRRLGQKMKSWDTSFDSQIAQFSLLKKIYRQNGLMITGGGACPEQYDILKNDKQIAYCRLRYGDFTVHLGGPGGEIIYQDSPNGDGIFDSDERLNYMIKAMREIIKRQNG